MKDVQDFTSYAKAKEYAESMDYDNGYVIEPLLKIGTFEEAWTVFEL